ncbi:MAG: TPM domain-containing protein [Bacteroidetes bacterium]|nr:TPM domain-containing protein [Bacteroidota bacterium]
MWNPFSLFKTYTDKLLNTSDKQMLVQAIQAAEKTTSGEIRVHVESRTKKGDALTRATEIFFKQKMNATKERNGVLVYVAVEDRKLAIYADQGIYDKVGVEFWYSQVQEMTAHFKEENYVQGMSVVIAEIGKALTNHFPYDRVTDSNELSDEIMIGK